MNVVDGILQSHGGAWWIPTHGARWPVPGPVRGGAEAMPVHYGVRPGDIGICAPGQGIDARVVVVEPTGAETELLLQIGDVALTAVLHERTSVVPDTIVGLRLHGEKVHHFSQADGRRLVPLHEKDMALAA